MTGSMEVEIVVPTYNCAGWIDGFFQSIVDQDFCDWRILSRDDASTDSTVTLLAKWERSLRGRLSLSRDNQANLGMIENYNAVLECTSAPWVMLADPDDIWLPGKISSTIHAMREAERSHGSKVPIVVCSDATVVDDCLQTISPSYWRWSRHNAKLAEVFHRMIIENPVLTSTMMVNRALLDVALPMAGAACPDWWLAMVACAFGRIVRLPQSTVLYRRHPANDSLDPMTSTLGAALAGLPNGRKRVDRLIQQCAQQAGAFLTRFGSRLPFADAAALESAKNLPGLSSLARRHAILRHHLWFASPLKNAGLMLLL
jgi:glycosyltransferase involved in cell wall biosynthesis